ncbi:MULTISPECIES: nicotinamide riboside transporter PnuC [Lentzea]|uniref:Nicotinamide mononucleotide transporter n=1 Tax=Lentzea jiangxiensis TaxID=641025 RepID=A0A1H0U7D9_9PSEU|nr:MULTISPECIES: nicotinamide riboside transporter PnuC [Lentzea]MCG8926763.1 nicotinamide riboside transporter PnuC [Lentzea sp. CC55]SDP62113.1 nicotinamide mononucleotide transporter [Lentzea jiangxiensis]
MGLTIFGQKIAYTELVGQVLALAVVFLAQRRSLLTWPVQLVSVALLFTVYMSSHLGGLATRQIVVGAIAVYGWYAWVRRRDPVFGVVVRKGSWRERVAVVGAFVVGTVAFALVLDALDASWAPWPDAAIFVGTILAFALQGLGLVEFWLVWLVVDAVGVPLQIQSGLYFSALVYVIFAGLVVHGFIDWNRTARRLTQAAKSPL